MSTYMYSPEGECEIIDPEMIHFHINAGWSFEKAKPKAAKVEAKTRRKPAEQLEPTE